MNTDNRIVTTVRVYSCFFETEAQMQRILRVLDSAPGAFDELWMGTIAATNPMEKHREEAARMARLAAELRKRGIRPSIELGCCIGHFDAPDTPGGFDGGPESRMVSENGLSLVGVHCPNSPSFTDWVCKVTSLYCETVQPDSFYIDDDLRFISHGAIREGCYCATCLKEFSERTGRQWEREELHVLLNNDEYEEIRLEWSSYHADALARFTGKVASAIHAVAPNTHIGNETEDAVSLYAGWGLTHFYKAIKDATGMDARVRIGGGIWNDYAPGELLRKALIAGCDADDAKASGNVDVITSELESCPCAALSKSGYSYGLEGAMHLAYGCNATAFQMGSLWKNDEEYVCQHVGEIARWRVVLDRLSEYSRTCRAGGLTLGISREFINVPTYKGLPNKCWYVALMLPSIMPMALSGFPVHWSKETFKAGLEPSIINGESALGLTEEDFRRAYANGLVLTGDGFLELSKRGFLDFTKVEGNIAGWAGSLDFLDTDLTKEIAGENWEWGSFAAPAVGFRMLSGSQAIPLGKLQGKCPDGADIGMWTYEDKNGRLAVLATPNELGRNFTTGALKCIRNVLDWVGNRPMPVRLESIACMAVIPKIDNNDRTAAVTVINTAITPQRNAVIRVRRPLGQRATWLCPGEEAVVPSVERGEGDEVIITLPELGAWQLGLLELK